LMDGFIRDFELQPIPIHKFLIEHCAEVAFSGLGIGRSGDMRLNFYLKSPRVYPN
jgi:hypothetical protein